MQSFAPISPSGFTLAVRFPEGAGAFEQQQELGLLAAGSTRSLPVHPVQLYEAALALLLVLLLQRYSAENRRPGIIFCYLIVGYAVIRFATEFFRADNPPIYLGFTLSQVISITLGVAAGLVLVGKPSRLLGRLRGSDFHSAGGTVLGKG